VLALVVGALRRELADEFTVGMEERLAATGQPTGGRR
jgi:hypothetical protein